MKKTTFDIDGFPTGHYDTDIHEASTIPADAIEITEEEWNGFLEHTKKYNSATGLVEDYTPPAPPALLYDELRRNAILEKWPMHMQFEAITENSMGYPQQLDQLKLDIIEIKALYPKPA